MNPEKVHLQRQHDWQRVKSDPALLRKKQEKDRKWRRANFHRRREKLVAVSRAKYKQDPEYWQRYALRKRFGLTREAYDELYRAQAGVCAICGEAETCKSKLGKVVALTVDHCHETGRIRGLLCKKCNSCLGMMDESPVQLRRAAQYLERFSDGGGLSQ